MRGTRSSDELAATSVLGRDPEFLRAVTTSPSDSDAFEVFVGMAEFDF